MPKKKGKFNKDECNFIERNCYELTPLEIAEQLNRHEATISKYLREHDLITSSDIDEHSRGIFLKKLHSTPMWSEVQQQLVDNSEIANFEESWIRLMLQFQEDLTYSEELEVKTLILLYILSDRVQKDAAGHRSRIEELERETRVEREKSDEVRDLSIIERNERVVDTMRSGLPNFTIEHSKILEKIEKITKGLKASRETRIKRIEDGRSSWKGHLIKLEDEGVRAKMGREMELLALSADKARKRLGEFHKFIDGKVDRPLLSEDTVTKEDLKE